MDPWFKFYASDYLLDEEVDVLPLDAQAILVRLWCLCWRSEVIPAAPEILALRTKVDPRVMKRHWDQLQAFFKSVEGGLISLRMERERTESRAKSESHRLGAQRTNEKRWGKRSLSDSPSDPPSDSQAIPERAADRIADRIAERSPSESESESEKDNNNPLPPTGPGDPPADAGVDAKAEVPAGRPKKKPKPRGRDFGIEALKLPADVEQAYERTWKGYPQKGWDFRTKREQARRLNYAEGASRFYDILRFTDVRHDDGSAISADELADATLGFVFERQAEAKRQGLPAPCIPCIANFFSSVEGQKHHWKEALMRFFDAVPEAS